MEARMAVYLDGARNRFGRMIMCHMIADSEAELHETAERIGMRRDWFQPRSFPHYDVCLMRKARATELGASVLDRRSFVAKLREIRARG